VVGDEHRSLGMMDGVCVEKDLKDGRQWNKHSTLEKLNNLLSSWCKDYFCSNMLVWKDCKQGVCPWGNIICVWV
jgi:hypothetical protein